MPTTPAPLDKLPDRLVRLANTALRDLWNTKKGYRTFPGIAEEALRVLEKRGSIGGIRRVPEPDGIVDLLAWLPRCEPPPHVDLFGPW